jgi:hypothetical protein
MVPFPLGAKESSFLHSVQTGSRAHKAPPIQWAPRALCQRAKRPKSEAGHSLPPSDGVINGGAIHPFLMRLHDLVFNSLSTETTLPF